MPVIVKNLPANTFYGYVFLISTVAALGGLLFGFDTAIISGTIAFIQPYFQLNEVALGWAVSSVLVGCAIGAAVAGKLSDMFGRKKILLWCGVLFALTGIGTGFSYSLPAFISFRILGGLAVGAAAMVGPMYIAETAPAYLRGRLVSVYQLAIVSGILLAYFSNYILADAGAAAWRWMFASQTIPSLLFIICLLFVPETPRWLVKNNKMEAAKKVLQQVGGEVYAAEELNAINQSFKHHQLVNWRDLLLPKYSKVMRAGCIIAVFQQITGINAILYYAPEIFKQTGVSSNNALLQTIGIGIIMLLFTFVAIWLVDKAGRKLLLLAGCLIMALALTGVAACFYFSFFEFYLVLICMMLYIVGFSASLGAVTWVLLSEIFPNSIRAMALSFSTFVLWLADFAVSFLFPVSNKRLGGTVTLLIFAALCLIYFLYIRLKVPETKNKTLEELETMLSS
jgi:MFS transporter, SP family, arabinose:H+ symporter